MNRGQRLTVLLVWLTLLLCVGGREAIEAAVAPSPIAEYGFYQAQYTGNYYYWAAYVGLWADGTFTFILRQEQQYAGGTYECDQVELNTLSGQYGLNGSQVTFPGADVDDLTDTCNPALNHHRSGPTTFTWSVR